MEGESVGQKVMNEAREVLLYLSEVECNWCASGCGRASSEQLGIDTRENAQLWQLKARMMRRGDRTVGMCAKRTCRMVVGRQGDVVVYVGGCLFTK